jgi:hypothetical protein
MIGLNLRRLKMDNYKLWFAICFAVCFIFSVAEFAEKHKCQESIVDMTKPNRSCNNGAKLKFVSNQWICSCEK